MRTAKQARETEIYVIKNNQVVEANEYDFIMESAERTTSPIGVMNCLHTDVDDATGAVSVKCWQGQTRVTLAADVTSEEADEMIFQKTWEFDFLSDDQRDTTYYYDRAEAERELESRDEE